MDRQEIKSRGETEHLSAEDAIRVSEEWYRAIYDGSPLAMVVWDTERRVVDWNRQAETVFGWTREEALGKDFFSFLLPASALPAVAGVVDALLAGNLPSRSINENLTKSGETILCEWSNSIQRDKQGKVTGVISLALDITQQKRAEEQLREHEARFRAIFNSTFQFTGLMRLDGTLIEANQTAIDFTGSSPDKIVGRLFWETPWWCGNPARVDALKEAVERAAKGEFVRYEVELSGANGETMMADFSIKPIKDENGQVVLLIPEGRDITERKRAEEVLQEASTRWKATFNAMESAVWMMDKDMRIVMANDATLRVLGKPPQEVVGHHCWEIVHGTKQPIPECPVVRSFHSGKRETMELKVGEQWFEILVDPILDKAGGFSGAVHVVTNITRHKRVLAYQEASQMILQSLNEPGDLKKAIQHVLIALKTHTGADAVGIRMQEGEDFPYHTQEGFSADFLLAENTLVERGKDGGVCKDENGNVRLECTCGLVLSGKTDPANPLFTKGGSCWVNNSFPLLDLPSDQDPRLHPRNNCIHQGFASVALIPLRNKDRIVGLIQLNARQKDLFSLETIEILEHIAAHVGAFLVRIQAESLLSESESRFRSVFEQSSVGAVFVGLDKRLMKCNPAFCAFLGYTEKELTGKYISDITHPDDLEIGMKELEQMIDGKRNSYSAEKRYIRKDGRVVWGEVNVSLVRDSEGKPLYFLPSVNDIEARKKAEEDLRKYEEQIHVTQKLESLGILAGGIAHDFNNILAAIMGNAELALDDISPLSPGRENLAQIVTASKRAADLCVQMLAYAGKSRIEKRNLALGTLVEEMLHLLKMSISKKAILNLNLEKSLPRMSGDPAQIRQILMNLVINASEAIGERSGVIALSTGAMDCSEQYLANGYIVAPAKPGTYVYIEVSDTGCGMDKDTVQRIFEPFFTTKFTGRGLGLAAVLGIVKAHEGALRVYSEPGKGSTFKVLFPAIDVVEDREPERDANRDWHGSGTVLLVDDEESIRAICSKQLLRLGLDVLTAEDGRQAVNLYRERKDAIALVLLDLTMPHMNGEEAFRELRQINPNVRVILASGYSEDDIAARFAGKGLAGCLQKPYTMDKLRSLLSTLLPKAEPTTRSEERKCPNNGMQTDG